MTAPSLLSIATDADGPAGALGFWSLSPSTPADGDAEKPDYKSPAYRRQKPFWTFIRDVFGGTPTMRARARLYLPRAEGETEDAWRARVLRAEFYNGFKKTHRGLVGMVFRRNPQLADDIPEILKEDAENIDLAGTHHDVFARQLFEDGMNEGFSVIFVDYPAVQNPDQVTVADEKALDLRPFWIKYTADQVVSYRTALLNGHEVLTQVVFEETTTRDNGAYGTKAVCQYRVLARDLTTGSITWALWEEQTSAEGKKAFVKTGGGEIRGQSEIPVAVCYCGAKLGYFEATPPLLDLAYTNLAHWQVRSDHRWSLYKASVPILVLKGRDTSQPVQAIGPNTAIDVDEKGDVYYREHSGSALGQTRDELKDLEAQMAALGLSMLQQESRHAETAEAKRLDKGEQDSTLATSARGLQDALERAWGFHAAYRKAKPGSLLVNQEFESLSLTPDEIKAYSLLNTAGQLSLETLWAVLDAGNALPEDFDPVQEQERLDTEAAAAPPVIRPPGGGPPVPPVPPPPGGVPPVPPVPGAGG